MAKTWRFARGILCASLLTMSACATDEILQPADPTLSEGTKAIESGLVANLPLAPVAITLTAEGSFKPGAPIVVRAVARANMDLSRIHLRLALPELAVQRRMGEAQWKAITGEILPNEVEEEVSLRRGASSPLTATVTFAKPGYYRVIGSGFLSSDNVQAGDRPVRDQIHEELWILILPNGGGLRATLDRRDVPREFAPGIGAFRLRQKRSQSEGAANVAAFSTGNLRRAIYLDPTISGGTTYLPLAGSQVYTWEVDEYDGQEWGHTFTATDANGYYEVSCAPTNYYTIRHSIRFANSDITFDIANWEENTDYYEDCGQQFDVPVWSASGFVFTQMKTVIARSRQMLGYSRGPIWIHLRDVPGDGVSYYTKDYWYMGDDRITIDVGGPGEAVFDAYGAFTQSHEYGHALHWRSLGEYPQSWWGIGNLCGSQHTLSPPSLEDWDCAYVEGFADYHAARVMRTEGGFYSNTVANNPHPDETPSGRYEIHVASFLFDLADSPAGDETFDQASYGDFYVATVIKTCQILVSGIWGRPDGVDGFVACFENTANTTFPGRAISSFSEQATEPGAWCRADIRRLWRANMLNDPQAITCGSI